MEDFGNFMGIPIRYVPATPESEAFAKAFEGAKLMPIEKAMPYLMGLPHPKMWEPVGDVWNEPHPRYRFTGEVRVVED